MVEPDDSGSGTVSNTSGGGTTANLRSVGNGDKFTVDTKNSFPGFRSPEDNETHLYFRVRGQYTYSLARFSKSGTTDFSSNWLLGFDEGNSVPRNDSNDGFASGVTLLEDFGNTLPDLYAVFDPVLADVDSEFNNSITHQATGFADIADFELSVDEFECSYQWELFGPAEGLYFPSNRSFVRSNTYSVGDNVVVYSTNNGHGNSSSGSGTIVLLVGETGIN